MAAVIGLSIPKTIISNDRDEIIAFLERVERAICKTLVCDYPHSIPTRPCVADDFAEPINVSLAPTIVQERIDCKADIRVCVIGNEVFAGQLVRANADQEVDWRMTPHGWQRHELPNELGEKLLRLTQKLGLETASIDLRLTHAGDYKFFEVNPSGQFLFLEIDAGLPLSDRFAKYLVACN
jgi:glutathione synthase/RimK-type ligase-like ATP-grasp enzyme